MVTLAELHAHRDRGWVALADGKIYDLTHFARVHPGGVATIIESYATPSIHRSPSTTTARPNLISQPKARALSKAPMDGVILETKLRLPTRQVFNDNASPRAYSKIDFDGVPSTAVREAERTQDSCAFSIETAGFLSSRCLDDKNAPQLPSYDERKAESNRKAFQRPIRRNWRRFPSFEREYATTAPLPSVKEQSTVALVVRTEASRHRFKSAR